MNDLNPEYSALRQHSISSGFTLLELLISLTILGLIMVMVFGSLRIGVRAWEKGEKDVEIHQRQRIVLDLIKRQIASVCLREIERENQEPFYLKGDKESMEFISRIPMVPGSRSGMVFVRYMLKEGDEEDRMRLLFHEKDVVFLDEEMDMEDLDEDEIFELISGVQEIRFEYLKGAEDENEDPEWQDAWDPETDEDLPLAVRIILREDDKTAPIHVIARIESKAV